MDAFEALLARRSVRRFTAAPVSAGDEQKLIEAAFAAPSGNNGRPWHFVFVRDPETRRQLKAMHEWTWMLDKAPLVVAVLADDAASVWWIEDGSAAIPEHAHHGHRPGARQHLVRHARRGHRRR